MDRRKRRIAEKVREAVNLATGGEAALGLRPQRRALPGAARFGEHAENEERNVAPSIQRRKPNNTVMAAFPGDRPEITAD